MQPTKSMIEDIEQYQVIFNEILDEYRSCYVYSDESELFILLGDIKKSLSENEVSDFAIKKICSILDLLKLREICEFKSKNKGLYSWSTYEPMIQKVFANLTFIKKTYYLLKSIGFVNTNVVLIGANGSGKTTFANSIRKQLEATENGIVIPAQKLLVFPSYSMLPTQSNASYMFYERQREVLDDKRTFEANKLDDYPYELSKKYSTELMALISHLLGEKNSRISSYCSSVRDGDIVDTSKFRTALDEVIDVWNNLISHRELYLDNPSTLCIKYSGGIYPAFKMSDGERSIFYIVGRVLSAKPSSLIVIDEPELHLHKAILNKLWDILEEKRSDCLFVYLTHDIDFASTRNAKKCWLKSYTVDPYENWDIEPIVSDEIPEPLLMRLLGSRKKILFCEGVNSSLDRSIYEVLFPEYTITPVATCKDVINYTRAFNKIKSKYANAYGIIDRDFRDSSQLDKLKEENIYSYEAAEIENLFLIEEFIKCFAEYKREKLDISDVKNKVIAILEKEAEAQSALYVSSKIDNYFKESHVRNGKNKLEIDSNFHSFISAVKIDAWYNERLAELLSIVDNKDYKSAIMVLNHKGAQSVVENSLGVKPYRTKALEFLKSSNKAKQILRAVFPKELIDC